MATLCLLAGNGAVIEEWEIGDQAVTVGRGVGADVKINDEGLSRRHFVILREGEDYLIKDLNSRNGTWVDGDRALTTRLRPCSEIIAGRTQFRFTEPAFPAERARSGMTGPHDTVVLPSLATA